MNAVVRYSQQGVCQPIRKTWVENDDQPASGRNVQADSIHGVARGRVHPAVDRQKPEGGHESAKSHYQRGDEMQALANPVHAKQHHAQKAGFQKKAASTS